MICLHCGSTNHSTDSHERLEESFRRYERWVIGWRGSNGPDGEPSPSITGSAKPDLLRIVPSTIGGSGWVDSPTVGPAILRLWNPDPAGGFTFTLSSDRLTEGERDSLVRLCGDHGSIVMAAVRFFRTTQTEVRRTMSRST